MKFKGINWRRTRTVVSLPYAYEENGCLTFGKIVPKDTKGAIETNFINGIAGERIYAKPLKCTGHSRTNMMYGKYEVHEYAVYTRAYLQLGGLVYTARWFHNTKTDKVKKEEEQKKVLKAKTKDALNKARLLLTKEELELLGLK
jgi:hypothetical protein